MNKAKVLGFIGRVLLEVAVTAVTTYIGDKAMEGKIAEAIAKQQKK